MSRGSSDARRWQLLCALLAIAVVVLSVLVVTGGDDGDDDDAATRPVVAGKAVNGITRTPLGEASPANAAGQQLYLQQVTIAPHAKLAEHFHEGTQVARVVSGVLTYNIVSGAAMVTRSAGGTTTVRGPKTLRLRPGDSLVETSGLVHFGANDTDERVVIELAALLRQGAPLATAVGTGVDGAALHLTTNLASQARTLSTAGARASVTYGWNRLHGVAAFQGKPVQVDMLASVSYRGGSGAFSGFVTFAFEDGASIASAMTGATAAAADGSEASFTATLAVIDGTGRYEGATGSGVFSGSRKAALGTDVAATFDLTAVS